MRKQGARWAECVGIVVAIMVVLMIIGAITGGGNASGSASGQSRSFQSLSRADWQSLSRTDQQGIINDAMRVFTGCQGTSSAKVDTMNAGYRSQT